MEFKKENLLNRIKYYEDAAEKHFESYHQLLGAAEALKTLVEEGKKQQTPAPELSEAAALEEAEKIADEMQTAGSEGKANGKP